MVRKQHVTAIVSTVVLVSALLACKKKPEAAPEVSATPPAPVAPAPPTATATVPAADAAPAAGVASSPKLGDVKRYGIDKESKLDGAGVRVSADELKVFNEADSKTPEVATLPKDLLVFRLVKVDDFQLVEFPSGIGQFSQGWVEAKGLSDKVEKVSRDAALSEKKTAKVPVVDGGVAPKASASAAPKASTSAAPKASASAAPKSTATASATTKTTAKPVPPPPPKPGTKKSTEKN